MKNSGRKRRHRPSSRELSRWFRAACLQESGALQQLLALYRPLLLKLAQEQLRGTLRTKVAPSDLVQITMWKATNNFASEQFKDRHGFLAWIAAILNNEAVDVRRRYRLAKKRDISRERSLDSYESQNWLSRLSVNVSASTEGVASQLDRIDDLLVAIKRLPSHYQLVLRLRYYERLKFQQIGAKLERTGDAARVLHNRALDRLRKELDSLAQDNINDEDSDDS